MVSVVQLLALFGTVWMSRRVNMTKLSETTYPEEYNLHLIMDPMKDKSEGRVTIRIKTDQPTDIIVLHAKNLDIKTVKVVNGENEDIYKNHTLAVDDTDFFTVRTAKKLNTTQNYTIYVEFVADITSLGGIYRGFYSNEIVPKISLNTQFIPTRARTVFPCYDEPSKKAQMSLTLSVPMMYSAVSNTEMIEDEPSADNCHRVTFQTTPRLPTASLGFAVFDFKNKTSLSDRGNFTAYARKYVLDSADYALDLGPKVLEVLERYFNMSNEMLKVDNVAVQDLEYDLISCMGINVYKEENFLFNETQSSSGDLKKIAKTISLQSADLWFGDMVTPAWWGFYWLRAGLATFFQHFVLDMVYEEEWRMMDHFVIETLQEVFQVDSFKNTISMTSDVDTQEEIDSKFDSISYHKGASIIRMMFHVLGEKEFQFGLRKYIENKIGDTVTPEMFFEQMQATFFETTVLSNGLSIPLIFSKWADQPSFPLIVARRINQTHVEIKQSRYFKNKDSTSAEQWYVPLKIVGSSRRNFNNTKPQSWLEPHKVAYLTVLQIDEWFLLNPQQTGYYRVMYDEDNWSRLTRFLNSTNFEQIHPLNRAQLVDDAFELAKTGRMHYNITLNLVSYLRQEKDFIPWLSAKRGMDYLKRAMSESEHGEKFNSFLRSLLNNICTSAHLEHSSNQTHLAKRKRDLAINLAYGAGMNSTILYINELSQSYFSQENPIQDLDPELRPIIYCHALLYNHVDFNALWSRYIRTEVATERSTLLDAMGCTPLENDKKKYLNKTIELKLTLKNYDTKRILISVIKSGELGCNVTLDFLTENFQKLQKELKNSSALGSVIDTLAEFVITDGQIEKFMDFVEMHRNVFNLDQKRAMERVLETIQVTKYWREVLMKDAEAWLLDYRSSSPVLQITSLVAFMSLLSLYLT